MFAFSCDKEDPDDKPNIPNGATPFTETDIQFVPYQSSSVVFKKMPMLDSTWIFQFKERVRSEESFAWDQTFFSMSNNADLEAEFRLRYLQSDVSQKTLAIYLPYKDAGGTARHTIFEMPVNNNGIEFGFFQNLVEYHDTIVLNAVEWYGVYEVLPLISTDAEKDGPTNIERIYYNSFFGLIKFDQKNGNEWILQP